MTNTPTKRDYASEVSRLDQLSRDRPLTEAESLLLERSIRRMDKSWAPYGSTRELARQGIKRGRAG